MKHGHRAASLAILGVLGLGLIGCEKESTPTVPANPPAPVPQASAPAVPAAAEPGAATNAPIANANTMAATATTEAQKLLDQAMVYIKDKKWDLADETLKKLEGMKASLPADWAPKIDQARTAFNAAKGMQSMPSMPGMPK